MSVSDNRKVDHLTRQYLSFLDITFLTKRNLGKHGIAPILDLILPHGAFQEERIRLSEGHGRVPAAEERHISASRVGERTYSHHLAAGNELIQECLVARIDGHNLVASLSCAAANHCKQHFFTSFHHMLLHDIFPKIC